MKRSWLSHLFISLSVGLFAFGAAEAATTGSIAACTGCHTANPLTNTAPVESAGRNNPAGAIIGSHAKHIPSQVATCDGCHVVPTTYDHRDGYIDMKSSISGGTYSLGTRVPQDNQVTTSGLGTCTNTCHTSASPVWGTSATCESCHGYPPVSPGSPSIHYGQLAASDTTAEFLSVHNGGCQLCHGTQSTTDGTGNTHDPHASYNVSTMHNKGGVTMNSTLGYNTTNRGCDTAGCHANDAEHRLIASGKTVDFFVGDAGASGTNCIGCHNTVRGTRDAVTTEFGLAWGHKKSGRGAVTNDDCIVCHLEGNFTTKSTSATYHANGNIDLRDPDGTGETPITNNSGATFTMTKFAFDTTTRSATISNSVADVITHKFCLKCHDTNGATNTTARSGTSPTATAPFGGGFTRYNAATAFATTNSSRHPVLAPLTKDFPTPAHFVAPYNGFTRAGTSGTKTAGIIINCFDCHNTPTTPLTTRTVTAHGNAVTLRGNATVTGTPSSTNSTTLCLVCHTANYTAGNYSHGTGSAFSTSTGRSTKQPYLQYGCNMCHASNYVTATTRPTRADDVHGTNVVPTGTNTKVGRWASATAGQNVPIAFIRNSNQFNNHAPKSVAGTAYTPTCMGGATGSSSCTRSSNESYTVGGTY